MAAMHGLPVAGAVRRRHQHAYLTPPYSGDAAWYMLQNKHQHVALRRPLGARASGLHHVAIAVDVDPDQWDCVLVQARPQRRQERFDIGR